MRDEELERRVARLLAGELPEEERADEIDALLRHAAEDDTGDLEALLRLLDRPGAERDLAGPPPPGYWDDFQARLDARLEAEAPVPRPAAWSSMSRSWAAAAVLLLAVAAIWLLASRREAPDVRLAEEPAPVPERLAESVPPPEPLPQPEPEVEVAVPETRVAEEAAEDLDGFGLAALDPEPDDRGGFFPDIGGLDASQRDELLRWLQDQNAAERGTT